MNEFDKLFKEYTRGQYPYLKVLGAVYNGKDKNIKVQILQSTAYEGFNETDKLSVFEAVKSLLPEGLYVEIEYIKTFADNGVVLSKVIQYFNKNHTTVFKQLKEEDISVTVDDYTLSVNLSVTPAFLPLLIQQNAENGLSEYLNDLFVESAQVSLIEKYIEAGVEEADLIQKSAEENQKFVENARLINLLVGDNVYGVGNLNEFPIYISDAKDGFQKVILCGKIKYFEKKEYNNKNFGLNEESKSKRRINTSDEKLPMYKFGLCDTTGSISAIIFPFDNKNEALDTFFNNCQNAEIVCEGSTSVNKFSGELQFSVKKMWSAQIDFSTVKKDRVSKKEDVKYHTVQPEKYLEEKQSTMFTEFKDAMGDFAQSDEISEYLKGKTFVIFDLETTGLNTANDKIIEIGAIKMSGGRLVETFSTLVNPLIPIPPESTKTHGIIDADVADKPPFIDVVADFYKFTRGAVLVAHNIEFDYPMLNSNSKESGYIFENELMDTLVLSRKYLKLPNYKLASVCEHYCVSLENAHRALDDAIACARCFQKLTLKLI